MFPLLMKANVSAEALCALAGDEEQAPRLAVLLFDEGGSVAEADRVRADASLSSNSAALDMTIDAAAEST
jgi:hypothetical protein